MANEKEMSTNLLLKSLCLQNRTSQYYYVKCNCPTRNVEVSYVVFDQPCVASLSLVSLWLRGRLK